MGGVRSTATTDVEAEQRRGGGRGGGGGHKRHVATDTSTAPSKTNRTIHYTPDTDI